MKVVLLKDVRGTGKAGQVVEVSDGYGRNFLLPKGFAKEATAAAVNAASAKLKVDAHRTALELEAAKKMAAELQDSAIVMKVKAGDKGRLFGAITGREIADEIKARFGVELDKKRIVLSEPIKRLGEYKVEIKPYANVSCTVTVAVEQAE